MATAPDISAFERAVGPVLDLFIPEKAEAILGFRPNNELVQRIEELAKRSTEGQLTTAERTEYEAYVRANKFVATLQRQARRRTASNS